MSDPVDMDVAVQIADHVGDARGFADIARVHDEDVFVGGGDDICCLGVAVEQLAGVQDRAGGELERQHRAVRRLDEPADAPPVVRAHPQFHNRQIRRRFGVMGRQCADGNGRTWRAHDQFSAVSSQQSVLS